MLADFWMSENRGAGNQKPKPITTIATITIAPSFHRHSAAVDAFSGADPRFI